jgi:hypothetical protein
MDLNLIRLGCVVVAVVSFRCLVQKKGEDVPAAVWFTASCHWLVVCDVMSKYAVTH